MKQETAASLPRADYVRELLKLTRLDLFPLGHTLSFHFYALALLMAGYSQKTPVHTVVFHALVFSVGGILLHAAFCTWNDICDRELDGKVERTRTRPLVTGAISVGDALLVSSVLLALSLLAHSFANKPALQVTLVLLPFNIIYPLTKRWTWWPQIWLGFACATGTPVAWLSVTGLQLQRSQLLALASLTLSIICWMFFNETIYGTQDRRDDEVAGIKSTSRLFGSHLRALNAPAAVLFIVFLSLSGIYNGNGPIFFVLGCGGAAAYISWQLFSWEIDDNGGNSLLIFMRAENVGHIMFTAMLLEYLFA